MGGVCSTITVGDSYDEYLLSSSGSANFSGMWPRMQPVVLKLLKQERVPHDEWQDLFWWASDHCASLVSRGLTIFAVREILSVSFSACICKPYLSPGLREVHRAAAAIVQHVQWPGEGGIWRPSSIPDCQRQGMDHIVMNLLTCDPIWQFEHMLCLLIVFFWSYN